MKSKSPSKISRKTGIVYPERRGGGRVQPRGEERVGESCRSKKVGIVGGFLSIDHLCLDPIDHYHFTLRIQKGTSSRCKK